MIIDDGRWWIIDDSWCLWMLDDWWLMIDGGWWLILVDDWCLCMMDDDGWWWMIMDDYGWWLMMMDSNSTGPINLGNPNEISIYKLAKIIKGEIISLISDAGTPILADPGLIFVKECIVYHPNHFLFYN